MKKSIPIKQAFDVLEGFIADIEAPVVEFVARQDNDPFKILIATILSSRTNDVITTRVISRLFERVTNLKDLESIDQEELKDLIYPVGFYRQKTVQLKKLPYVISVKFAGTIPSEIDDLVMLPGVGRKTANLVRNTAFGKPAICVDVHVHRITNRWGYVNTKNPLETELELRAKLPVEYWSKVNHYLVSLGQTVCKPRNPKCPECALTGLCPKLV